MAESTSPVSPSGPLAGLRAVELGSTVAGPFCARLLADFGADVIKVEQPDGDVLRTFNKRRNGRSLYGASIFRSKRNIAIDLRSDAGRALVRRLCEKADIVVENFRPGTLEQWGLGYDALSKVNPGLVLVRISGFGQTGPYSHRPGYGVTCEAVSGLRGITGDSDRPPPRIATSLSDYIAGLYGAFGAVMAILERQRSGKGQVVDSALYEGAFSFMEPHIPAFQQLGLIAERAGSRLPGNAPNMLYQTRDEGWIHIAAASDAVFNRLTDLMGRPELKDDPRFATAVARADNMQAIDDIVAGWTIKLELSELERLLEKAVVPAARIYSVADIFDDPHFRRREMLVDVPDQALGPVTVAGIVPKLSATPGRVRWAGRQTGEDSRALLKAELGLSEDEIDALARDRVVLLSEADGAADEPAASLS